MPRDKFAAMASRANKATAPDTGVGDSSDASATATAAAADPPPPQQEQQQNIEVSATAPAPKRDKMAALAARSNINQQQAGDVASSTSIATASPPKRDKMAALVARSTKSPEKITGSSDGAPQTSQQQQVQSGESHRTTTASPPKRDKMAALAARSNNNTAAPMELDKDNTEVAQINPQQQQQQKDGGLAIPTAVTPRRDKLAALASRSMNNSSTTTTTSVQAAPSRNNKLAKLADSASQPASFNSSTSTAKAKSDEELAAEAVIAREKHLAKLKDRLSKRKGILDSLDRAEMLTCKLLKIAAQTTNALQDLNFSSHLPQLSVAYRSTLQELHPLLTMGTEKLIKPYQNHTKETKQSMYAARVEMRLAKERLEVLKTFSALEKASREKQQDPVKTNATTTADDESDRKRKR
jgi:hypothetical protein